MSQIPDRLFILELANNHMGDVEHGIRIIKELKDVTKDFPFNFAIKLQYRDLDTFIHPDFKGRDDIKYVKRFSETKLSKDQRRRLVAAIKENGFTAMCTPFDEESVGQVVDDGFDILKIGSCSFADWPLIERAMATELPLILSTAGASLSDIDNVSDFCEHHFKDFALMHCIAEYPTRAENMQLNQIDLLRTRFPHLRIGYSTHEVPGEKLALVMSIAKGCTLFEKHVGVPTDKYSNNDYSASPLQVKEWLQEAVKAFDMLGIAEGRVEPTEKEISTLLSLRRGVFAKREIKAGESLRANDIFFAIPTIEDHVTANEWSKYTRFRAVEDIPAGAAVTHVNTDLECVRESILSIVTRIQLLLKEGNIVIPQGTKLEISHHYGLEKFDEVGAVLITLINRDYCKKIIAVLPGQKHPTHFHKKKDETLHVLHGTLRVTLDGVTKEYGAGEMIVVEPGMPHSFESDLGSVFEEISSTHFLNDSVYTDDSINNYADRKTVINHWNTVTKRRPDASVPVPDRKGVKTGVRAN